VKVGIDSICICNKWHLLFRSTVQYPNLSPQDLAKEVLEHFRKHSLFTSKLNPDGSFVDVRSRISGDSFTNALGKISSLNGNGFTAAEEAQRDATIEKFKVP
jgi:hypothetical protein